MSVPTPCRPGPRCLALLLYVNKGAILGPSATQRGTLPNKPKLSVRRETNKASLPSYFLQPWRNTESAGWWNEDLKFIPRVCARGDGRFCEDTKAHARLLLPPLPLISHNRSWTSARVQLPPPKAAHCLLFPSLMALQIISSPVKWKPLVLKHAIRSDKAVPGRLLLVADRAALVAQR